MHKNTRSRVFPESGIFVFCFLVSHCMNPPFLRILLTKEMNFMKNNMLQNLETVRKKELPPVKPADSPVKIPVHDPYGTDDPDTLTVRAASVTDCTGLIPSGTDSDEVLESYAEIYHYPADIFHGS